MTYNHTTSPDIRTPTALTAAGGFADRVKNFDSKALCEAFAAATESGDIKTMRPCDFARKYGLNKKTASRWIKGDIPRAWNVYLISKDPYSTVDNVGETALYHGVHHGTVRKSLKWRGLVPARSPRLSAPKKINSKALCEKYAKIKAAGDLSLRPCELEAKYDLCKATSCRWAAGDLPNAWKAYLISQDDELGADNVLIMMRKHDAARSTVKKALRWKGIEFIPRACGRPKEKKNPLSDLMNGWGLPEGYRWK